MNKYSQIYLLGLLLVYMLFASKSCEEQPSAAEVRKKKILHEQLMTIEKGMKSDYLRRESIPAYEEKAKQKVIEFSEYLSLYAHPDLDSAIRSSIEHQIKTLLFDQKVEFEYATRKGIRKLQVDDYLAELTSNKYDQVFFTLDSVKIYRTLGRSSENLYKGTLSYLQITSHSQSNDSIHLEPNRMLTEFYVQKVRKQFGNDMKYVWQVYLGDMKIRQNK